MPTVTPSEAARSRGISLQQLYAEIMALHAQGVGISDIGVRYNIIDMTVGGLVNRLGRQQRQAAEGKKSGRGPSGLEARAREKYGRALRELLTEWVADATVTGGVMADRLGCTVGAIHHWLNKFGLKLPRKESHLRTRQARSRDYEKIISAGRKTLLRRVAKGSTTAEKVYNQLQVRLLDQPLPHYDIVVGMNQWHIIPPKEVDIAVVAIRRDPGAMWGRPAYTFAVEVDGAVFHAERAKDDAQKDELLRRAGWPPFRIVVPTSCSQADLEAAADKVFADILQMIIDDGGIDSHELRR